MPELAILLARTLSISTFSTSLLKSLFQISAKFSLLLLVLLLTFKITDSLRKAFSKRAGRTVFQNFLLSCQRQLFLGAYLSRTDNTVREQITDNFVAEHLQYQTSIIVFLKSWRKKLFSNFL